MIILSLVVAFICDKKGAYRDFEAFLVCALGTLLGNWAELGASSAEASVLYCRITYIFIAFLPVFWALFAWRSMGRFAAKRKIFFYILSVIPLATIALQFTNDFHYLVWRSYSFVSIDGRLVNHVESYGPWFWVHVAYSYGLYLWGAIDLIGDCLVRQRFYRLRSIVTCFAVGLPIFVNVFYVARRTEAVVWDISSIFFSLSGFLLAIVMVKFKLFEVAPPSRRALFEVFDQGITVLDEEGVIVDMNRAAMSHFGFAFAPLGASFAAMPELSCLGLDPDLLRALPLQGLSRRALSEDALLECEIAAKDISSANSSRSYVIQTRRLATPTNGSPGEQERSALSPREEAIYELLLTDKSNKEIAFELKVSSNTLKTHIKHVLKKKGCANREELKGEGR